MYNEHEEYRVKLYDVQETGSLAFVVAKNCNSICRVTALERPIKFKNRLDDLHVDEGADFTLSCEMTVDKLTGFWTFEDEPIRLSDRYQYEVDGTKHMLHVKGASYDCIGKYGFKCGKKFTFSAVTVKEIEVDILSGATDLQIKEGKQFCLSVVASNPKASIQWRKDGRAIIGGDHVKFSRQVAGEKGQGSLILISVNFLQKFVFKKACFLPNSKTLLTLKQAVHLKAFDICLWLTRRKYRTKDCTPSMLKKAELLAPPRSTSNANRQL